MSIRSISSQSLPVLNAARYRHIPVIGNYIIIKSSAKNHLSNQDPSDEIQIDDDECSLSEDSISSEENDQVIKSHSTISAKIKNSDFNNESP